jgi:GT2 family glycosyltransferase|tara:strand:- start:1014 stop:2063 length:1050 start_codon:yes stop_codon:yes gene_type:complete
LQSVQAAIKDISSEIIVIDNNSSDDSCSVIKLNYPEIILIQNKENIGFSKANNQAVKIASGEYICILNPDTVVSENTFNKILKFSDSKNDIGIVGCRFVDGSGAFLAESKRKVPTIIAAIQKLLGFGYNYYETEISENQIAKVSVLTGAFMLMKNNFFRELGGFDENFFMYGEDIDLSFRALKMNKINYYYGKETIIHFKGESTRKNKIYYKNFFSAMQVFYNKHYNANFIIKSALWLVIILAKNILPFLNLNRVYYNAVSKEIVFLKPRNQSIELPGKKHSIINSIKLIKNYDFCDLVFDPSTQSFSEIIKTISRLKSNKVTFKIWPKNTNFIIGSDANNKMGEVINI